MKDKTRRDKEQAAPKRRVSPGIRLLAAVVSPIAFLLLLELILTLLGYGLPRRFFLPWRMGAQGVFVANRHFCEHFVPRSLSRAPEDTVLLPKSDSTFRIFVLGGSAANGDPDPAYGFCRQLEILLNDHAEGTRFEVVNAAITAMNSHVARRIAGDCARHDPDLFIVYVGNNEVVGPYGPPTLPEFLYRHRAWIDASVALKKDLRVGQLVKDMMQAMRSRGASDDTWQGMEAFLDCRITLDDPKLQTCYQHFKANVSDMVASAHSHGVRTLICTVPTNIASCAPFGSAHRVDLLDAELARWNSLYEGGRRLFLAGDHAGALVQYEQAMAIDDRHAELVYGVGQCLLRLDRLEEARLALLRARDLDVLRFRADTAVNQAVRDLTSALSTQGASLLDMVSVLEQANKGRPLGGAFLLDHVHLTVSGNFHVARAAMQSIKTLFPAIGLRDLSLSDEAMYSKCQRRLLFDAQAKYEQAMVMYLRKLRPPFAGQLDHEAELAGLRDELFQWRSLVKQTGDSEATYTEALHAAPGDLFLVRRYGDYLVHHKRASEAIQVYKEALGEHPYDRALREDLARAYAGVGGYQMAMEVLMSSQAPKPLTEKQALQTLGTHYVKQNRYADALKVYTRLDETAPMEEDILINLASASSYTGDMPGALLALNKALKVNPKSVPAMVNMGNTHVKRGQTREALSWFERAAEIDPYNYIPQFSRGMQLLNLGQVREGMKYVTLSVHLKPDFLEGYSTLVKVYTEFDKPDVARKFAQLQALFTP
jgi:tetratricopeptide (TPR) repeat protein